MKVTKKIFLAVLIVLLLITLSLFLQIFCSINLFFSDIPATNVNQIKAVFNNIPFIQYEENLLKFLPFEMIGLVLLIALCFIINGVSAGFKWSGSGIMISSAIVLISVLLLPIFYKEKNISRVLLEKSTSGKISISSSTNEKFSSFGIVLVKFSTAVGGAGLLLLGAGFVLVLVNRKRKKTNHKTRTVLNKNMTKLQKEAARKKEAALKLQHNKKIKTEKRKGADAKKEASLKIRANKRNEAEKRKEIKKRLKTEPLKVYLGNKPFIFISYAHKDTKEVIQVLKELNIHDFRLWFDEGINPGEEWPEIIGNRIRNCSQFIVFMSPAACKSRNVRNEVNFAFNEHKKMVVVYFQSTKLTDGMQLQIGTVQHIDKYNHKGKNFINKLVRVLKS